MGLVRLELTTPRLSSVCSNQLSYRPSVGLSRLNAKEAGPQIDLGLEAAEASSETPERR